MTSLKTFQCEICGKEIKKDPKLSNKQFENKKYCSLKCKRKGHSIFMKGKGIRENNSNWKGDIACLTAFHKRVEILKGKPKKCEICGTTKKRVYDWANLTGNYKDINDYKRMCRSCHKKYDLNRNLTEEEIK